LVDRLTFALHGWFSIAGRRVARGHVNREKPPYIYPGV
jgi:hypothetical protein